MVSQRQRLARKRFREANPDLFPKPEPLKDPSLAVSKKKEKKKKYLLKVKSKTLKSKLKPKDGGGKDHTFKKHPLRVPGMRPGESCFICKSTGHIAKMCPEKSHWDKNKICLLCRQRGHSLKYCPEKSDLKEKYCYNCGEGGHSLSKCPLPIEDGGTKFASCFICNETGHLSKNCPKNTHGIYPKGGSCKLCGGVTHLAKDCPNKGGKNFSSGFESQNQERQYGMRTVFHSGDDLEDDFMNEDAKSGTASAVSHPAKKTASVEVAVENKTHVKPKKKQGPKVVNFAG